MDKINTPKYIFPPEELPLWKEVYKIMKYNPEFPCDSNHEFEHWAGIWYVYTMRDVEQFIKTQEKSQAYEKYLKEAKITARNTPGDYDENLKILMEALECPPSPEALKKKKKKEQELLRDWWEENSE